MGIDAILTETLGEHVTFCATVKNFVVQFKRADFSTCVTTRPRRRKTVTIQEIIEQIHELIWEDHRVSVKSVTEKLGVSLEPVGFIIHENLDMRKLPVKWIPKCLNANEKRQRCHSNRLRNFCTFFRLGGIQMISCRYW